MYNNATDSQITGHLAINTLRISGIIKSNLNIGAKSTTKREIERPWRIYC
jgi:hypothetical protein